MNDPIIIRTAVLEDAEQLLKIYAPYVEETAISFEYQVPGIEEFRNRMQNTLKKYPYLTAQQGSELLGYAYTSPFVGRQAYSWSAETTIYLKRNKQKQGLGKRLYQAIEAISRAQNLTNLYACIGYPETEDEYLTKNSAQFHAHLGYRMAGTFHQCGYKFDRWYHMIWLEKILQTPPQKPQPVIKFPDLDPEILRQCGVTI